MPELALKLIAENKAKQARGKDASYLDLGRCGLITMPNLSDMDWLETLVLSNQWWDEKQHKWKESANKYANNILKNIPVGSLPTSLCFLYICGDEEDNWEISNADFLKGLTNLQSLDLSHNQISNADCLSALTNLKSLNLSSNQISNADFLKGLTNLRSLGLNLNALSNWDFLKGLTNLQSLDLAFNYFRNGDFLKGLTNLQSLDLGFNGIIRNWGFLKELTNLRSLNLTECQIRDGDFLKGLTNLQSLDLSFNDISNLESFLHLIQKRGQVTLEIGEEGINLYGNPITYPPPEIVVQGNAAILNYFAERSKQQFKNTQLKLILLGNSTVGKTTLSRYFREKIYYPAQPTTHGIQNHRWQVPELNDLDTFQWKPDQKNMEVNIWDFGGQEYYHATHRLFLSRNAVYILVWDAKTDKGGIGHTEIHYENDPQSYTIDLEHFPKAWWLKNLNYNLNKYARHEREGNAPIPVLLVQNKCAAGLGYEERSVPIEFEQKPYFLKTTWTKHHIDLVETANEQGKGEQGEWTMRFKLFENELLKTLESQMATYEFALYHRDIRDRIRALASGQNPVTEMPWTDFEVLCRDIDPDAKMDLVQIYLRDITGDILYFDQNERLRQRVFLRPDWVCNRIYDILSRKVLEHKGIFDLVWVYEALQCDEQDALDFVELMREFQLIFEENDENGNPTGNFVAPQYLPDKCTNPGKLEGAKEYANLTHAFTLWFPEFLPKSHVARFVAHWGHQAKQRLFWKNGLLFQTDGCTVLVERQEEFKIRVDVQMSHAANREKAIRRVFRSFLDLEDGQAGFAVSFNGQDFAFWQNIQKAIHMEAKQVENYSSDGPTKFIELKPFFIFHKPITMAKKVFISYSHKDESFKDDLDTHFSALKRSGLVEVWHDRRIDAGTEWDDAIKSELESADIILLLISANFLASEYIWKVEIARAMERHQAKEAKVIPIFTRSCDTKGMPFESIQGLPRDAKPIATFTDKDEAYVQIAKGIRAILEA